MVKKFFLFHIASVLAISVAFCQNTTESAGYLFGKYRENESSGNFVEAEALLHQILDGGYGLSAYRQALIHNALGYVYYESGQYEKVIGQYQIAENLCSGENPDLLNLRISIYNNTAMYHNLFGDYTIALEYYGKANRLLDSLPEKDESYFVKLSMLQFNMGVAFYKLGQHVTALGILKESLQVKERHGHSYRGSVYFNLARVYQGMGQPDLSGQNYLQGIDRWILDYDSGYYELGNLYLNYGQFLIEQGNMDLGSGYLQKALQIYLSNYGSIHPLTALCHETIGEIYLKQNDFEKALHHLQLALVSVLGGTGLEVMLAKPENESAVHHLTLLKILVTKVLTLEAMAGDGKSKDKELELLEAAQDVNQYSIQVLHRIQGSYLSSESRLYLTSRQKDLYTTGIRINIKLHELTGAEEYKEQAFLLAASGKSNELLLEKRTNQWLYLESLSDSLAMSTLEVKQQIDYYSNLIQIQSQSLRPDSTLLVHWQDQLFEARESFNRKMAQLRLEYPQFGQLGGTNNHFSLEQVRKSLKREENLVEYFISGPGTNRTRQLYAFVVTKSECNFIQTTIDSSFSLQVATIMQNIHGFNPYMETRERYDSLNMALLGIYEHFIQPLESMFSGKDLVIVPDEELGFIPFDALIKHFDPGGIMNYAGLPYLLHDYNISYLYNARFTDNSHPTKNRFPKVTAWVPGDSTTTDSSYKFLKGAMEEAQQIVNLVRGRSIMHSLSKQEAKDLLQENSIIHLAMHAMAQEGSGGSPYFILDPEKNTPQGNRLHDYEISSLALLSPMVVLSSCETAAGHLHSGEGIMSLSRSFLQAGAASVVHSLWPVEDAKGRDLMIGLYKELKRGNRKSRAMSNAKKRYLASTPPF